MKNPFFPFLAFFFLLFIIAIPAHHVQASNLDQYLAADHDLELPYINDAKEPVKFRGTDNFHISWHIPAAIALRMVRDESGNLYYSDMDGIYSVDP